MLNRKKSRRVGLANKENNTVVHVLVVAIIKLLQYDVVYLSFSMWIGNIIANKKGICDSVT